MRPLLAMISQHLTWDFILYGAFLGGQLLTILRRAGMAVRSVTNPARRRRDYIFANWDLLLVRTAIELPLYWVWRHNELNEIFKFFGKSVPFQIPNGSIAAFAWGFFSDSTLDWLGAMNKIGPWEIPSWLKENIPKLPPIAAKLGPPAA